MAFLLNIRVLIALALVGALAFSHFTVYRWGKNEIRKEWLAATAAANLEASRFERQRQQGVDQAQAAQSKRNGAIAADLRAARGAADSLRETLNATERMAAQSHDAANNAVRTLTGVLGSCTAEYLAVAEEADRAFSEVKLLRDAWPR